MPKTKPTFKETKHWILSIEEIESMVFDNVISTKSYLLRNYKNLDFNTDTLLKIHDLVCSSIFNDAWTYRKHNVQLWEFSPIDYFNVQVEMKKLEWDIEFRSKDLKTEENRKKFIAEIMWKILWIHPFFDYNWRSTRLFWELFMLKNNMLLSNFAWTSRNDFSDAMKRATFKGEFEDIYNLI